MKKSKQLVTHDRAVKAAKQHTSPCADCPFRRAALPGWLGGHTPEEYRLLAHSDALIECHAVKIGRRHAECAGVAIYRANVVKRPPPGAMKLPPDKEDVFATPGEFVDHHSGGDWKAVKTRLARADGQDAGETPPGSAPTKGERP